MVQVTMHGPPRDFNLLSGYSLTFSDVRMKITLFPDGHTVEAAFDAA